MPEVRLQACEIIEVDDDQDLAEVRRPLITGAVGDTTSGAYAAYCWNRLDGMLEGGDERLLLAVGQFRLRSKKNDVRDQRRGPRFGVLSPAGRRRF